MPLMLIPGGFQLEQVAGLSYLRMIRDGMPSGGINSAYRDPVRQAGIFRANYTSDYLRSSRRDRRRWDGVDYWRRSPYTSHVAVAVPGTSKHNYGLALDLGDKQRAWVKKQGADYGWIWPPWAQKPATYEPWHFEYEARHDTEPGTDIDTEDDMTPEEKALLKDTHRLAKRLAEDWLLGQEGLHHDMPGASMVRATNTRAERIEGAVKDLDARVGRVGEQNTYTISLIKALDERVGRVGEQNTYIIGLQRQAIAAIEALDKALTEAESQEES